MSGKSGEVQFGDYAWDLSRSSVRLIQFEGFIAPDASTLGASYTVKILENFFGVQDARFCPVAQVCSVEGGGNGVLTQFDGFGFSVAEGRWLRRPLSEPPSGMSVLLAFVIAFAFRRRQVA